MTRLKSKTTNKDTVILSIKPEYANKIFDGSKKYEFRKTIFKSPNVKKVIVYASSPVMKVIGEFEIESILKEAKDYLWEITHKESGISEDFFKTYFQNKEEAIALKVKKTHLYSKPKSLQIDYGIKYAPQSFVYL